MTAVTLRPVSDSETKSGSAIGIGCTLPCVMSSLSTAPAERGANRARAPAPTSRRRRVNGKGARDRKLVIFTRGLVGAVHIFGIEGQLNFFPTFVMLGLEHIERLAGEHGAHRAVARCHCGHGASIHARKGRSRQPAIWTQLDGDIHDQLVWILHADRRTP